MIDGGGRGGAPGPRPRRWGPRSHDRRVLLLTLCAALPGTALGLILLWTGDFTARLQWTLTLAVSLLGLGFALAVRERVVRPLQTLSNLLGALREGDFSIRARGADPDDALGLALFEVNSLGRTLREQRLGVLEATALLNRVMREIDVAVFALDPRDRLRLVNRAGERLLGAPSERVLGRSAEELGLDVCLRGAANRTFDQAFPGRAARWELRRGVFRQGGEPHRLIVLSDLTRALREEERQAWRKLVRVLSHEINNSLAPIHSIAGTLGDLLERGTEREREPDELKDDLEQGTEQGSAPDDLKDDLEQGTERGSAPDELRDDLQQGLRVIGGRAEALRRFMASYAQLARLPPPRLAPVEVGAWVARIAELETRVAVSINPGPPLTLNADPDQLDQLLINVIRNAADAALETGGAVRVRWQGEQDAVFELVVEDDGPGIADEANLFTPFFTTKPQGSGIGLVLARQIAEGHQGTFTLRNREDGSGCVARLLLPPR